MEKSYVMLFFFHPSFIYGYEVVFMLGLTFGRLVLALEASGLMADQTVKPSGRPRRLPLHKVGPL
jgi:hypothetical protein